MDKMNPSYNICILFFHAVSENPPLFLMRCQENKKQLRMLSHIRMISEDGYAACTQIPAILTTSFLLFEIML